MQRSQTSYPDRVYSHGAGSCRSASGREKVQPALPVPGSIAHGYLDNPVLNGVAFQESRSLG